MEKIVPRKPLDPVKKANVCHDNTGRYVEQSEYVSRSPLNPSVSRHKQHHASLDAKDQNPYSTQRMQSVPYPMQNSQERYSPMERWRQETAEEAPWNNVKAFAALSARDLDSRKGETGQEQKQRSWSTQGENGSVYEWR